MRRWSIVAAVAAALSLLLGASGESRVVSNTVAAAGTLDGAYVLAVGVVGCDAGERLRLQLTVTQRSTGAVARGGTRGVCSGAVQEWPVRLERRGRAAFTPGAAQACGLAVTGLRGKPTDAVQWCRAEPITLDHG